MPFAGFSDWEDCINTMSQREGVDDPDAVCGRLKADNEKRLKLSREEVSKLCAPCGKRMAALGIKAIAPDQLAHLFRKMDHAEMEAHCKDAEDPKACMERLMAEHESEKAFRVAKIDEDQQLVFGWANVAMIDDDAPLVDLQDDWIEPAVLEKAAQEFVLDLQQGPDETLEEFAKRLASMTGQVVNEMHVGNRVGRIVEALSVNAEKLKAMGLARVSAPAAAFWVGFKIDNAETFQKVKRGELKMFSIEGSAVEA